MKYVKNNSVIFTFRIRTLCKDYITKSWKHNIKPRKDSLAEKENFNYFQWLPIECVEVIIKFCPLKDQIQLAKVCQQFYHLLQRLWSKKYTSFTYSILELKYQQHWNEIDIRDACILLGKYVRVLRFCTLFRSDMLIEIQKFDGWNPIERLKKYLNLNFISNLKYFENVEELEIQGKMITDFVIEALAYKCKRLKSVRFLNGTTQSCSGTFLHRLTNIQKLEMPASRNIGPASLMLCCEKNSLRYLNITECKLLEDVPIMVSLCHYWSHLTTLKLTAFSSNGEYLRAILNLSTLQDLQMYWTRNLFDDFVRSLLEEIHFHKDKCKRLQTLAFECDRYSIEDPSTLEWTRNSYAKMRELVWINSFPWIWTREYFTFLTPYLKSYINLTKIYLIYARIMSNELLYQIPVINSNVQLIQIEGCARQSDATFLKEWDQTYDKCRLKFKSFLNANQVDVS